MRPHEATSFVLMSLVAALALGMGCREPMPPRPSVILVVFDTTRADDWSFLEPHRRVMPTVDDLASRGLRFSNAWSLYSVTVPSHISLFTGHAALASKSQEQAAGGGEPGAALEHPRYGYERSSLFTILENHGYRTYAFSGNRSLLRSKLEVLTHLSETAQSMGKDEMVAAATPVLQRHGATKPLEEMKSSADWHWQRRNRKIVAHDAAWVNQGALRAMREHALHHAETPYLLFLNYNDAHDPYFPAPPFDERFPSPAGSQFNGDIWAPDQRRTATGLRGLKLAMTSKGLDEADIARARALHLGELAYADEKLGELLAELRSLGLMEDVVIVLTADHGETFGEGGRMSHAGSGGEAVEEALLHIPLVMLLPEPGIEPRIIEERVDLRDVKPSVLEFLGIEDDTSRGRNLLPLIRGEVDRLREPMARPQDHDPGAVGDNLIGGQDADKTEGLEDELRELGYIE